MTTELTMLGWTLVLALAQILIVAALRTSETGLAWNMGARDEPAPPTRPITARMQRAQANLFETLPLFAAAVLVAHVAGRTSELTAMASVAWFGARVLYVPLYAFGVPMVRSLVWGVAVAALVTLLAAILR